MTRLVSVTCRDGDPVIDCRVLDKDNANAVVFDRTVIDTPEADPTIPSRSLKRTATAQDMVGDPWRLVGGPRQTEVTRDWTGPVSGPTGPAQIIDVNVEVCPEWPKETLSPFASFSGVWGDDCGGVSLTAWCSRRLVRNGRAEQGIRNRCQGRLCSRQPARGSFGESFDRPIARHRIQRKEANYDRKEIRGTCGRHRLCPGSAPGRQHEESGPATLPY